MIMPFKNLSNRNIQIFVDLFYTDNQLEWDNFKLPINVYKDILNDYQSPKAFKKHLLTISHKKMFSEDLFDMAINFKKAAREIADFLVQDSQIGKLDSIFFSLAYMYRQSIELIMKAMVFQLVEDEKEQKEFTEQVSHDLEKIINYIELKTTKTYIDSESFKWLKIFLINVSEIDRASDSFRYPFRIKRDPIFKNYELDYVFKERKDICLVKLVNKFEIAFEILHGEYKSKGENIDLRMDLSCDNYSSEFLEEGGHYFSKSVIGYNYNSSEMYLYIQAYKSAADYLFNLTLKDEITDDKNSLISFYYLPISYLYRNSIELALKELCFIVFTKDDALRTIHKKKHNLSSIWNRIKENYRIELGINLPESSKTEIEKSLTLINDADPTSSRFRYPFDKDLDYYFSNGDRVHLGYDYYNLRHCLNMIDGLTSITKNHLDNVEIEYE